MKNFILIGLLVSLSTSAIAQDMQARIQRVDSEGEVLESNDDFYYTIFDRITSNFKSAEWEDEITQIKVIRIVPADDPVNWYYYISCSTKNTSSPFYVGYDPHNTYMGTYFIFDKYPPEFQEYATSRQEYAELIKPSNIYKEALAIANDHKDSLYNNLNKLFKEELYSLFDTVAKWNEIYPDKAVVNGNEINQQYIYDYTQDFNNSINNRIFKSIRLIYDKEGIRRTGSEGFIYIKDYDIRSWVRDGGRDIALSRTAGKLIDLTDEQYKVAVPAMENNFKEVKESFRAYYEDE